MPYGHPFPLDVGDAHGGGIQQQVDQVVVEQVDLVHVEDAAVGGGQQARLVGLDPLRQRPLQVQGADQPVSCGPSGQAGSAAAGSQENRQPGTTSTSGSSAANARTTVDLAVPFSPRT